MAINTATGKRPAKVTPANKVGSRTKEEIVYVERPSIQQKSSINLEQEREEAFIREITDLVHKEENAQQVKQLNRILNTNKTFKAVLQVHRVEIYVDNEIPKERYIPQSKLVFETDDEYYHWATKGGFDRDLNPAFDYIVLRRIFSNV